MRIKNKVLWNFITFQIVLIYFYSNFHWIDYGFDGNPDIENYMNNFSRMNMSYDIGFEYFQSVFRDIFLASFDDFWFATLLIISSTFAILNAKLERLIFAFINFAFLSHAFGTQVRYFLPCILIVLFLEKRVLFALPVIIFCMFFHYGLVIVLGLYLLTLLIERKYSLYDIFKKRYVLLISSLIAFFIAQSAVLAILPHTRFAYYADSFYMEPKSLVSLFYVTISLVFNFAVLSKLREANGLSREERIVSIFGLVTLLFIMSTSSMAVLSGRILLFYVIYESIWSSLVFKTSARLYLVLLLISFSKLFSILYWGMLNAV